MMQFNQKIQADIYQLDPAKISTTAEALITQIIYNHNGQDYLEVSLIDEISRINGFQVKLFINDIEETDPDWIFFLREIAKKEDEGAINELKRKYPSFLLFFYKGNEIFVLTKGAGRFVIINYIVENFGVEVLERLVDPTESDLRMLQERGVIGSILAAQKHFKPDHKFSDEQSFGKFYKSVEALISKDNLEHYLGVQTDRKNLIVSGENTLKINTRITIEDIGQRISKVSDLLRLPKKINFNKFKRISNKKLDAIRNGEALRETLTLALLESIYDEFVSSSFPPIYHPDIFKFLEANQVKMSYKDGIEEPFDLDHDITLSDIITRFEVTLLNLDDFLSFSSQVTTYLKIEGDEQPYTTTLQNWFIGEIEVDGQKYFKFDGNWFSYDNDFILEIRQQTDKLLAKLTNDKLPDWGRRTEGEYNKSFKKDSKFLVCDTATYKNIEICDFMQFDIAGQGLKIYHVKDGWGQSIRVVYNQIMNGARFISEMRAGFGKTNSKEIKEYYNEIVKKQYNDGSSIPVNFNQFKKLINRKITFVLVYGHKNTNTRNNQISNSTSNIAKLSIIQCENELRSAYSFNFDIIKVQR